MHVKPPLPEMVEPMRRFSHSLRERGYDSDNSGVLLYRGFLRGNIREVLKTTFPLLNEKLKEAERVRLIEQFMALHGAQEAQFPQIARELLCFVQQSMILSYEQLMLMEYDWVLYHCNIADVVVPVPVDTPLRPQTLIRRNPTLETIHLPWLSCQARAVEGRWHDYLYAIYRTAQHQVMGKKLNVYDVVMFELVIEHGSLQLNEIEQRLETVNPEFIHNWIICNRETGLIWTEDL